MWANSLLLIPNLASLRWSCWHCNKPGCSLCLHFYSFFSSSVWEHITLINVYSGGENCSQIFMFFLDRPTINLASPSILRLMMWTRKTSPKPSMVFSRSLELQSLNKVAVIIMWPCFRCDWFPSITVPASSLSDSLSIPEHFIAKGSQNKHRGIFYV